MKLSTFVITLATIIGVANATHRSRLVRKRSSDDRVALVVYEDNVQEEFDFQECIPVVDNGTSTTLIAQVTFLRSANCYPYSTADCSGSISPPIGIPFPQGVFVPNVADFAQLVGQAAKCYPNPLPGIPLKPATI